MIAEVVCRTVTTIPFGVGIVIAVIVGGLLGGGGMWLLDWWDRRR